MEQFMAANPYGSVIKGVLLNFGLNAALCLLWLPICGIEMLLTGGSSDLAVAEAMFYAVAYIGVVQLVHVLPASGILASKRQSNTLKGMLGMAFITFVIWLIIFVVVQSG